MLTVLQVVPALEAGGVERTAVDIAAALVRSGARALVASSGGRLEAELAAVGGRHIGLPLASKNPVVMAMNVDRLKALCRREGVGLIHARSRAPAWSALRAARDLAIPFVTTYHGIYNGRTRLKRFYNGVMARGDLVIANSHYTAELINRVHGRPLREIVIIPRGMDLKRFDPSAVSDDRKRVLLRAWGVDGFSGRIVLMPGRLTRWKGQIEFIKAFARLREQGVFGDVVGVLCGDAQGRTGYLHELDQLINQFSLEDSVKIVHHTEDMPAAFSLADLMVSASIEPEAFGRVATEAQAMGLPVIATDHGGARETVIVAPEHDRTGWRVPPGDDAALAAAMADVLTLSAQARSDLGVRAMAHVRAEYDVEVMAARTLKVYESLVQAPIGQV